MLLDYALDFFNLLYPTPCAVCECIDPKIKSALCSRCYFSLTQVSPLHQPLCASCGNTHESPDQPLCLRCLHEPSDLNSVRSIAPYHGAMQEAILAFKFHGRRELAGPLGLALLSAPKPPWQWHELSALIPVPMHQSRFIERKFDHTRLLTQSLQKHVREIFNIHIPIITDFLVVKSPVPHQTRASREQRLKNLHNAFSFHKNAERHRHLQNILLIDDVVTTGATLSGCAKRLREQNPHCFLHGLTLARTSNL